MKVCHKCKGTFSVVAGLNSCQCISGYERGFEPELTTEQAATEQVRRELEWLSLFVSQERETSDSEYRKAFDRLLVAMKTSPACGHGMIDWELLTTEVE